MKLKVLKFDANIRLLKYFLNKIVESFDRLKAGFDILIYKFNILTAIFQKMTIYLQIKYYYE